jgi:outer membrane protein assembly factor BamA/autotransporter translocation and assembly factor TamB
MWRDLESSAKIFYENGAVKVTDLRVGSGTGKALGSAEIKDQIKTVDLHWSGLNLTPAGFPATTDGELQLQWQASDFKDLAGKGSILTNSRQYGRAQTAVTIQNARANLDIRANAFDSQLHANITTGLDQTLSGSFQATNRQYGDTRLTGTLGGTFKDPQVNAKLMAAGITYNGVGPVHASANTSLKSRIVAIDNLQVQLKNSSIPRGSLRINLDSQRITGDLPEINVQPNDFVPDIRGTATFSAVIEGTLQKPSARLTGSSKDFNVSGIALDDVKVAGEVDMNSFRLTELSAQQRDGTLSATASYNFTTEAINGSARLSNVCIDQVQDLSAIATLTASIGGTIRTPTATFSGRLVNVSYQNEQHGDLEMEGTVQNDVASVRVQSAKYTAEGKAEIGLKEPYSYTASVTANRSHVAYQQFDFTANGSIQASGDAKPFSLDRIRFDDFTIGGLGADLTASGSFPDGVKLNGVADLSQIPMTGVKATGQARVQAVLSGTLQDPRIEGSIETSNATVQAEGMSEPANIRAAVDFTRNEFVIRLLQAAFAGATADVSGRGTLQGTGDFKFHAESIRPERFLKDRSVAGVVALEGDVHLSQPSVEGISGLARITQLDLTIANTPIRQVEPIEVRFENQVVTTRNILLEGLNTRTSITGNANLRTRELDFNIDGNTDVRVLELFLPGSNPRGEIRTSVAIRGTPETPNFDGSVNLTNIQFQIADPPISITDANAQIQVRGDRVQIAKASGKLNGGTFTASGGMDVTLTGLGQTSIQVNLMGAQTEYPEGFESEISSRLSLNGSGSDLEISGNVDILNGVYRRNIDLTQEVFSRIATSTAQAAIGKPAQQSALDSIKLNIAVATPGFVSVANNLANFDMEGSFRLRGTIGNPAITGRATVAEGGEIYFGPQVGVASATEAQRRDKYVITQGSIDFINPIRTEPNFNFVATREVQTKDERYIITLHASGTPDNPKTELTSDPELDEPNIVAVLLTGRTLKDLQGAELLVAQEQAASYVSGRFVNLFQSAGSAFGLNTVRIDPVLVAGEEDLSAKLTLGKDLTQNFSLVYSQNLSGKTAQTWIANYQALQNLLIRGVNLSEENKLRVELRHDLKWGGGPPLPKGPKPQDEKTLGQVTFEGASIPMEDLLKQVTKTGKPFTAYRLNEDLRKLRQFYAGRGFLEANIRAVRNPRDGTVDVHFTVDEGPSITFEFQGAKVPKSVQEDIRQIWIRGFAEASSLRQSQDRLVRHLRDEGYLQVKLGARDQSPNPSTRRFVFEILPGPRFNTPKWVFKGIEPIELGVTPGRVLEDPKAIQDRIAGGLWKDGYLNASCTEPKLVIDGREALFEVSVERGPRYSIGTVTANDADALQFLPPGEGGTKPAEGIFTSAWLDRARQSVISKYWERGFNDVQVVPEVNVPKVGTTVNIDFTINPGEKQVVDKIEIEGNRTTDIEYIRRQFTFKEGDPVDHVRLNLTRKNLYDTRLFKRVDLNVMENGNGYIARTTLNEKPPWNFRYGFAVTNQLQTSDREFGATADFSYSNLLGKGITAGTSTKYTPETREARVFSSVPVFLGKNVTTTGAVFRTRDLSEPLFIADILGFTVQQQWQLRNRYLLSYDYSYKSNHTFDRHLDPNDPFAFDLTIPIARFNGTLSRDSRDDLLNATKGTFLSNSFELAPPGVGSSIQFMRNFTQFFRFRQVGERLVLATGVRMGVAKGFHGQELIPTEKFRAGGGTTLRAFQQDKLTAIPGDALFIVNQELRFPLFWRFSGVSFIDAGNVYSSITNFNPLRLRYSPGAGVRIQTPVVLIRFDMGLNVSPRIGEPRYRFAFGVGQAF